MTETSLPPAQHPLSRFQLLQRPMVIPGHCAVCGTPNRPVVDFGMTLEFYGAVYLCEVCLTEAARTIGMVTAEEFAKVKAGLSQSLEDKLKSKGMRAVSNERFDILIMAINALSDAFLFGNDRSPNVVDEQTGRSQPTLFEDGYGDGRSEPQRNEESNGDDFKKFLGSIGDSEQSNDSSISEGPFNVSGNSGNGSSERN